MDLTLRDAVLLPSGAKVRLRRLPLEYRGDAPPRLRIAAQSAAGISLGAHEIAIDLVMPQ